MLVNVDKLSIVPIWQIQRHLCYYIPKLILYTDFITMSLPSIVLRR